MAAVAYSPTCQPLPFAMSSFDHGMGPIDYVPNPDFVFPARPASDLATSSATPSRVRSLNAGASPSPRRGAAGHMSVSALPTFTFNASDTSGRVGEASTSESAGQIPPLTPRAGGHRRGASEFVGGDARFGMSGLVSTSPTKASHSLLSADPAPLTGSPARKRGHAHRRSAAISAHDLSHIIQPSGTSAQAESSSAPLGAQHDGPPASSSPATFSSPVVKTSPDEPVGPRPRVGFSEDVEVIPRPLSFASTESGSNMSTPASTSIHSRISSVIDLDTATPTPSRTSRSLLRSVLSDDHSRAQSSLDSSRSMEREGQSLRREDGPALQTLASPSPTKAPRPSSSADFLSVRPDLDRRRSEPALAHGVAQQPAASSLSLQDTANLTSEPSSQSDTQFVRLDRRSSVKKVKAWASAMMHRKEKDTARPKSMDPARFAEMQSPQPVESLPAVTVSPSEEHDLEDLFSSNDPFGQSDGHDEHSMPQPRFDLDNLAGFQPTFDNTEVGPMLDLDSFYAADTPSRGPRLQGFGAKRQLHSSRTTREFGASGSLYHRRTESAPVLPSVDFGFSNSPMQSPMADVFEEDEEAEEENRALARRASKEGAPQQAHLTEQEEQNVGVEIVDRDNGAENMAPSWDLDDGLGIRAQPGTSSLPSGMALAQHSAMAAAATDRRPSVIQDTILEEEGPIEIVEDHEEPRASVLTKSSDSSGTPTILVDHSGAILSLGPPQPTLMTPTTYAASTFSSPDFARRQGSFDTSRLGTSASSITDSRTMSSYAGESSHGVRNSVDDMPSLTSSSRSTMTSNAHVGGSRRTVSDRSTSATSAQQSVEQSERRRKRSSIQSLSKLVGSPFGESKNKLPTSARPLSAAAADPQATPELRRKKENRLSRLMFWKHNTQSSRSGV